MNKKIKIVIGINSFSIGGAQKQLVEQFEIYDLNKFDFYLIITQDIKDEENFYDLLPKKINLYKLSFKNFRDIKSWIKLIRILKNIKPDIVMSSLFFSNTVFRILKPFFKYKSIARIHNTYINKTKLQILIDKILSFWTSRIIAVSQDVADFTSKQERIPRHKFITINNGINLNKIENYKSNIDTISLRDKLGFNNNDKIILNVGRLCHQKNQKLLINSFDKFLKQNINKDYKLVILGDGGLKSKLLDQIKNLNLEDRIFLLGNKNNIFEYYLIADFLISTSIIEGLSNVYLEALAFGLPLVVTKTAGTNDLISEDKNGFFIEKNTENSVIRALNKIDIVNKKLFSKNSLQIVKKFDINIAVKKYENLFLEILNH